MTTPIRTLPLLTLLCLLSALLIILLPLCADAQTRVNLAPLPPISCGATPSAAPPVVEWTGSYVSRLEWCVEATEKEAMSSTYVAFVDGAATRLAIPSVVCAPSTYTDPAKTGVVCGAPVSLPVVAALNPVGLHRLELLRVVGGKDTVRAPAILLQTLGCPVVTLGAAPAVGTTFVPAGTPVSSRTSLGTQQAALAVSLLRRAGYRTELHLTQWAAPTPTLDAVNNGQRFIFGWCVGTPQ